MTSLGHRPPCCDLVNGGPPCVAHRERERVNVVRWWQRPTLASTDLEPDVHVIGMRGEAKLWPKRGERERGAA